MGMCAAGSVLHRDSDTATLKELTGHRSIATTQVYLRKVDRQRAMGRWSASATCVAMTDKNDASDTPQIAEELLASSPGVGTGGTEAACKSASRRLLSGQYREGDRAASGKRSHLKLPLPPCLSLALTTDVLAGLDRLLSSGAPRCLCALRRWRPSGRRQLRWRP